MIRSGLIKWWKSSINHESESIWRQFFLDIWGLVAKGLIPGGGRGWDSQVGRGRVKGCGIEGFTKEKGELMIRIRGESHFRNIALFVRSQVRSQERLSSENLSSLYSLYY